MSEPDAVPLPREGEVFFDVRGDARCMRLSWYAESRIAVFSIWQGNRCTGTFRLPFADLARMVETLQSGPSPRVADAGGQLRHGGRAMTSTGSYPSRPSTYAAAPVYPDVGPYEAGAAGRSAGRSGNQADEPWPGREASYPAVAAASGVPGEAELGAFAAAGYRAGDVSWQDHLAGAHRGAEDGSGWRSAASYRPGGPSADGQASGQIDGRYDGGRYEGDGPNGGRYDGARYDGSGPDGARHDGGRYDGGGPDGGRYEAGGAEGGRYEAGGAEGGRYEGGSHGGAGYGGADYGGYGGRSGPAEYGGSVGPGTGGNSRSSGFGQVGYGSEAGHDRLSHDRSGYERQPRGGPDVDGVGSATTRHDAISDEATGLVGGYRGGGRPDYGAVTVPRAVPVIDGPDGATSDTGSLRFPSVPARSGRPGTDWSAASASYPVP